MWKTNPDFEKLAHVIQHGVQGFIVKNMEAESTEVNDLSHIKIVPLLPTFSQNLTLQEAFETVAQMNEELNITE